MSRQPLYFERIRQSAARRWDQLEQDPELAGPWHQLFKQVQSPRHILSELLQNADDAGATEASVRVKDHVFQFEHNGEDFSEEHFASLCRFGYSNKRALHTIGFRGVGFKSTFSLGDQVELFTPSLSICFNRRRFTEPKLLLMTPDTQGRTFIRVKISDHHRQREVEKNLEEWIKSPISLLFFRNIRRMRFDDREIHWNKRGPGPIPESELMALEGQDESLFVLVRSEAMAFPIDALTEIRQERMLDNEDAGEFPPCKVEVVLGAAGRLYVVLPTGVETRLPFACNAPFIQDPARLKIKDPETSPTNRWLLSRAGNLAASAMLRWLERSDAIPADRACAYKLLPDVDRDDNSLEGTSATIVEEAFDVTIADKRLLLTEQGQLVGRKQSIIIPAAILDVWPGSQAAEIFDKKMRPPLCQHVSSANRVKLLRWDLVDEVDRSSVLRILSKSYPPEPKTWHQLMNLWAYIAPEVGPRRLAVNATELRIVPVQGKNILYSSTEVVRLGEKKILQSECDWEFLANYLIVMNQNWPRFLAEQRRESLDERKATGQEAVEDAYAVLEKIGLSDTSDVSKVINQVAAGVFSQKHFYVAIYVQLAQIAAKLGAKIGDAFRYVNSELSVETPETGIFFDEEGKLEELVPEGKRKTLLLHPDYSRSFNACSRGEWIRWVDSGFAGLLTFVPLRQKNVILHGRNKVEQEAQKRGLRGDLLYPYRNYRFTVEDWDFEELYWSHWRALAADDETVWVRVVEGVFAQPEGYWTRAYSARLVQVAATGRLGMMTNEKLLPSWIIRLREQRCLPDTRGFARKPEELLRRTPETESLMDVEPFVHGRLDRESVRPLLELLGVGSASTSPDRLLDRLRALARAEQPPVLEVEKWYRRLDQMIDNCSTTDFQKIQHAFQSEKLIFVQDGTWTMSSAVFLSSDEEDVPEAAVIRPSISELAIWRKIGVAERPTADLAIEWLKGLPSGKILSSDDARRVRALLVRHPTRIWKECAHWLNLAGEWAPIADLAHALTMQSLIPWSHLHLWVKQKTADLQRLSGEAISSPPFSALTMLSAHIEERFRKAPLVAGQYFKKEWLTTLGLELCHVELETDEETERVRNIAVLLARTNWVETAYLEIIPYMDGTPAGTPRRADVVWLDGNLYVEHLPKAKLARRVPEEIGKAFARQDIKAVLDYSFERSAEDVREYLEENFKLSREVLGPIESGDKSSVESTRGLSGSIEQESGGNAVVVSTTGEIKEASQTEGGLETVLEENIADAGNDRGGVDDVEAHESRIPKPERPIKPGVMERFAEARGFRKVSQVRFCREDGSWIGRAHDSRFPWELRTNHGDLVRYYWPKDHCLEREPLQLEADIWALIEHQPEMYSLVLLNAEGDPIEVTGTRLRAMRDGGEIVLYPATYRIVYDHERQI